MACKLEEELANKDTEKIKPRASNESALQDKSERGVGVKKGEGDTEISDHYPNTTRIMGDESNIMISSSLPNSTMLAQTMLKREEQELDTSTSIIKKREITNLRLTSSRARILAQIYETIGREQVNRKKSEFAPAWVVEVEEALKKEYD